MELHSRLNLFNNLEVVSITNLFLQIGKLKAREVELKFEIVTLTLWSVL